MMKHVCGSCGVHARHEILFVESTSWVGRVKYQVLIFWPGFASEHAEFPNVT
jgi:hypothetical protein